MLSNAARLARDISSKGTQTFVGRRISTFDCSASDFKRGCTLQCQTTTFPRESNTLKCKKILKLLLLSIVLGLVGLGLSSTREPWGANEGFPFAYTYSSPCTGPLKSISATLGSKVYSPLL